MDLGPGVGPDVAGAVVAGAVVADDALRVVGTRAEAGDGDLGRGEVCVAPGRPVEEVDPCQARGWMRPATHAKAPARPSARCRPRHACKAFTDRRNGDRRRRFRPLRGLGKEW
jgi:hypothetical protein